MNVAIVDYGMGNLRSVAKAVEHVAPELELVVTADPAEILAAQRVIIPGQGAMHDCMREFDARGVRPAVLEAARSKPFLGVCVGMQMLFEHSEEGDTPGLGLVPGRVRRFAADMRSADGSRLKVPHMGWNGITPLGAHPVFAGIEPGTRFYFVHSYYCEPALAADCAARCDYGIPFTCAIARDNIVAVQFHPEKSAQAGLQVLANFLHWHP